MVDDDLVDPLDTPGDGIESDDDMDDGLEDLTLKPLDKFDVEIVDEFDEDDFDEDFDDDFEEEIVGEYELEDDRYGADFDKEFGHLTDPSRATSKKTPDPKKGSEKKKK